MEPMKIITYPHPILRKKLSPVTDFTAIDKTISEMSALMIKKGGIGLAANQVGLDQAFFIAKIDNKIQEFINPRIHYSPDKIMSEEGCLSLPGVIRTVERSKSIIIEFQNKDGVSKQMMYDRREACVLQHEFDHLLGILLTDGDKHGQK